MRSSKKWICLGAICCTMAAALAQDAPPTAGPLSPQDVHATPITLHVKHASLNDVIEQLNKQSGAKIQLQGSSDEKVTIDADQKPFWEVLSSICEQSNFGVMNGYGNTPGTIFLMQGMAQTQSREVIAGPMLATFSQIERIDQMTAAPERRDFCDVQVQVTWEPRLAVSFFENFGVPTVAVDENGLSLIPIEDTGDPRNRWVQRLQAPNQYGQMQAFFSHSIHLTIPSLAGRKLAHLSGKIRLWVADKTTKVSIDDLQAAVKSHPSLTLDGNHKLKTTNVWISDNQIQVQLQLTREPGESADAWNQRKCLTHSLKGHLVDADDKTWGESIQMGYGGNQGDTDVVYTSFQRNQGLKTAPKKLTLEVPSSAAEVDVPYDLKDLPLP